MLDLARINAQAIFCFLLSDIEGSVDRWERYGKAMAQAVTLHDAIMTEAIGAAAGAVVKSTGDGILAVFSSEAAALSAAAQAQRQLAAADFSAVGELRVRMGVHSGTAELRGNDYFGPALNHVARLTAVGHGGQILVSEATTVAAGGTLQPFGLSLVSLGRHRLRDLSQAGQIYQLGGPGLAPEFPALGSVSV